MGKGNKMIEEKPKTKAEKVSRGKKIQKHQVTLQKPEKGMEIEGVKDKFDKKYDQMMARKARPSKITKPKFDPTPRPDHKPETLKNFEKLYDASVSAKSIIVSGMSKGQKRRTIKKEKLQKKKVTISIKWFEIFRCLNNILRIKRRRNHHKVYLH